MYQCSKCGSDDPDHACPVADVVPDPEVDAAEEAEHKETGREKRLRRILELKDEGWADDDIGKVLGLSAASVRGILNRRPEVVHGGLVRERRRLTSSLAVSLTNHSPDDQQIVWIEQLRKAADELCRVIDSVCPESREASLAKTHLEESVMWSVKSVVLPREDGKVLTAEQWQKREAQRLWDEA